MLFFVLPSIATLGSGMVFAAGSANNNVIYEEALNNIKGTVEIAAGKPEASEIFFKEIQKQISIIRKHISNIEERMLDLSENNKVPAEEKTERQKVLQRQTEYLKRMIVERNEILNEDK